MSKVTNTESSQTMNRLIMIVADHYEKAHGKGPRGTGNWILLVTNDARTNPLDQNEDWDSPQWINHYGTYSEASKVAVKAAREQGYQYVLVAS